MGWYLTFGPHDWLVIGEFPDNKAAASAILAAAAGGSLSEIETTVAMTAEDAKATFGAAGKAATALGRADAPKARAPSRHQKPAGASIFTEPPGVCADRVPRADVALCLAHMPAVAYAD
jgi:hypothetical protein